MKTTTCPFIEEYMIENKLFIDDGEIKIRKGKKIKKVELLDDRRFIKVYIQSDDVLANLKNSTKIIFEYIFRTLQSSDSYNTMEIEFSYKDYTIFNKRRNIENPVSEKSFYNARTELIKNRIIALKEGTTYWYNFNYFFNGDRFSVVKEYVLTDKKIRTMDTHNQSSALTPKVEATQAEISFQSFQILTEEECARIPFERLKKLNINEYEKHTPIWWAILNTQTKTTKFTHAN